MRPMFEWIKSNWVSFPMKGAEIGVFVGENAVSILDNMNIGHLLLVDSYPLYTPENTEEGNKRNKEKAFNLLSGYKNVQFLYHDSVSSSSLVEDNSLDFVYIDADHSYAGIKPDILAWFPKVRRGGVIGGHDFDGSQDTYAVYRAVCEIIIPLDYKVNFRQSDWWIVK